MSSRSFRDATVTQVCLTMARLHQFDKSNFAVSFFLWRCRCWLQQHQRFCHHQCNFARPPDDNYGVRLFCFSFCVHYKNTFSHTKFGKFLSWQDKFPPICQSNKETSCSDRRTAFAMFKYWLDTATGTKKNAWQIGECRKVWLTRLEAYNLKLKWEIIKY